MINLTDAERDLAATITESPGLVSKLLLIASVAAQYEHRLDNLVRVNEGLYRNLGTAHDNQKHRDAVQSARLLVEEENNVAQGAKIRELQGALEHSEALRAAQEKRIEELGSRHDNTMELYNTALGRIEDLEAQQEKERRRT